MNQRTSKLFKRVAESLIKGPIDSSEKRAAVRKKVKELKAHWMQLPWTLKRYVRKMLGRQLANG